jgi:amino acid transporter
MFYSLCAVVGLVIGMIVIMPLYDAARRKRRKAGGWKRKRKLEFTKLVLFAVLATYFVGVALGVALTLEDPTHLSELFFFLGGPTSVSVGFYCWKARAENAIKLKRENPKETEGHTVDVNGSGA